jgi:outer membrane protein assembly factor BamB
MMAEQAETFSVKQAADSSLSFQNGKGISMIGAALVILSALSATPEVAGNWASFRNGSASQACGALPLRWSPKEGIAWECELPGYGQSAPVIWNGVVYVTAVVGPHKDSCVLLALDGSLGKVLWRTEFPASTRLPSNYSVARAAPTPLVDGRSVYAFFEGGDVVAVSHQGDVLWRRSLTSDYGEFNNHHGLGSSPAQTEDTVLVLVEHRGPSYLAAFDKRTGETLWKVERKPSMSWSSPVVMESGGKSLVVISSGGSAQAYYAASGQLAWSLADVSGNSIPSPTVHAGKLFLSAALSDFDTSANAARSNLCLDVRGASVEVVWRAERAMCDYASPVVVADWVYYINRSGVLYCLDRHTGREQYTRRLPGPCWATPIAADGRLHCFSKNGVTTVIAAGPEFVELATNELWDVNHPPAPESYSETPGGHGHEPSDKADQKSEGMAAVQQGLTGFAAAVMRRDNDGDGRVSADELEADQQRLMDAGDKNGDGFLDANELKQLGEQFRARRQSSQGESRDPIVYGTAAAGSRLFLRTGTRLYCVGD